MSENMKHKMSTKILVLLGVLLITVVALQFRVRSKPSGIEESYRDPEAQGACRSTISSRSLIQQLSLNRNEDNDAASKLVALANESPGCRDEIVSELVEAMNKGLVEYNHSSFLLWAKGSAILGELKAVETLDFLIDNLDFSDGLFSASMNHQPVVPAVEKMGELAVPKLAAALKNHPKRDIRLAAALCLLDIGNPEALDALKSSLTTETDECVRRFVTLSLPDPAEGANSKRKITAETGEMLMQRLLAFRCGN